jgi:antibiotic biosynthesis monooxygenase (ABM) superfamily enzyme
MVNRRNVSMRCVLQRMHSSHSSVLDIKSQGSNTQHCTSRQRSTAYSVSSTINHQPQQPVYRRTMKFLIQSALFAASLRSASAFVSSPKVAATFAHRSMTTLNAKPFAVVVNAEIQPDRMDEFMKLIEENAISTRKEPGCLRFGTSLYILGCYK